MYQQVQRIVYDQAPMIPLYNAVGVDLWYRIGGGIAQRGVADRHHAVGRDDLVESLTTLRRGSRQMPGGDP